MLEMIRYCPALHVVTVIWSMDLRLNDLVSCEIIAQHVGSSLLRCSSGRIQRLHHVAVGPGIENQRFNGRLIAEAGVCFVAVAELHGFCVHILRLQ